MTSTRGWIAGFVAVAAAACSGGAPAAEAPAPALRELARLNNTGRLEASRFSCALQEAPIMATRYAERLPEFRRTRAEMGRAMTEQHARSVQESMRASDRQTAVVKAALRTQETAAYFDERGDISRASQYRSWAIGLRREAGVAGDVRPGQGSGVPILSDEAAGLLVEYSRLRSAFSSGTASPESVERMRQLERDEAEVVDAHAGIVLGAYHDPELSCSG